MIKIYVAIIYLNVLLIYIDFSYFTLVFPIDENVVDIAIVLENKNINSCVRPMNHKETSYPNDISSLCHV